MDSRTQRNSNIQILWTHQFGQHIQTYIKMDWQKLGEKQTNTLDNWTDRQKDGQEDKGPNSGQMVPTRADSRDGPTNLKTERGCDKSLRKKHMHTDRQQTGCSFHGSFCRVSGEGKNLSADGIFITSGTGFATQSQLRSSKMAGTDLGFATHTEWTGTLLASYLLVPMTAMKALSQTCHKPFIELSPATSQRLHKMSH